MTLTASKIFNSGQFYGLPFLSFSSPNRGGHFTPDNPGHFTPDGPGQFAPDLADHFAPDDPGQFDRILH